MSEYFLVYYILCSLPHQCAPFKISCNTHKDKWSINKLLTMCVQEEERLIMEEGERVNLTTYAKNKKNQAKNKGKIYAEPIIKKESKCSFCKKKGHMKKDCIKKPVGSEQYFYSGGRTSSHVEAIETCNLILNLHLWVFPLISWTLVLLYPIRLKLLVFGALIDGLYEIKLQNVAYNSMHVIAGVKKIILYVMTPKIGYISIERIKQLILLILKLVYIVLRENKLTCLKEAKNGAQGLIHTLDFIDFETCVDCIKEKQTNKSKRDSKRSTNLLKIIHIYIFVVQTLTQDEALDAFIKFLRLKWRSNMEDKLRFEI
ncbi:hypothetical protein CR513_32716, partial [Mucuna pruriens]